MENLKEFWGQVPEDIKKELVEFATSSLGISKEDKEEMRKFIGEYADIYEKQCSHIEDNQTRCQLAYGLLMKKFRLTGGGGDVPTRIKPFSISTPRTVTLKSGEERIVLDVYGLARREDMDGDKISYVVATFWGEDAITALDEMKVGTEYKTSLVWRVQDNGAKSLGTAMGSQLMLEPQDDNQFPTLEEFSNIALQDSTKIISGLDDLLNYEKMMQLSLYSKSPTDIKVLTYATVIDSRLIEKGDRKIGLMEIIDKSILTDREKSLIVWVNEDQLVGRGSIIHLIGEVRPRTDVKTVRFNVHFIYPVKVIKFVDDYSAISETTPTSSGTPPVVSSAETPPVVSIEDTEEKKDVKDIKVEETDFDDFSL